VDNTPEHGALIPLRRRQPVELLLRWQEAGVRHAQRLEDVLPCEPIERLSRDALDEPAEDLEADVAVGELLAGTRLKADPFQPMPGLGWSVEVVAEWVIRNETPAVPKQVFDRDRALAVRVELGQVANDRVLQADLPLFEQDHRRGRGGNRLGE
jgi:hypothetical protein